MFLNSISKKNMLGYVVIFIVLLVFALWLFGQLRSVHSQNSVLMQTTLPAQQASEQLIKQINELQIDAFALYGTTLDSNSFQARFSSKRAALNQALGELRQLSSNTRSNTNNTTNSTSNNANIFIGAIDALATTMAASTVDWDRARGQLSDMQSGANALLAQIDKLNLAIADDAKHRAEHIAKQISGMQSSVPLFLLLVGAITIGAYFYSRMSIAKPVQGLSATLDDMAEHKDLSKNINIDTGDEVGLAAKSVNELIAAFSDGAREIRTAASTLLGSVTVLNDSAGSSDSDVSKLTTYLQQILETITALEHNIDESATRSMTVAEAAKNGAAQVKSGAENVRNTSSSVVELTNNIEKSREELVALQNAGDQVSSVVKAIADIAEQTNLLALNAAIEAARAGESGRGFAVVADEVRTLASRTHESTHEINTILESIVSSIANTVEQMANNSERASATVELAETTVSSLDLIEKTVIELSHENELLSEQAQITKNDASAMRDRIDQINAVSESVSASTRETRHSSDQLADLAHRLDSVSRVFKC
ncbi:methyl-accepting chemotaxis protein [Agaribacterium haliotis]|uniref:methyl-accepting chemotaxis protein n=1 Tax=Agaribacterium haliotis TaxID=2013869 RepID=UPI000BB58294|nr:methyl-accepting chemotaxis protein [Agaribacterium haliotis]